MHNMVTKLESSYFSDFTAKVYYDEQYGAPSGWVVRYFRSTSDGYIECIGDSEKAWHPDMPTGVDDYKLAVEIAQGELDRMAAEERTQCSEVS